MRKKIYIAAYHQSKFGKLLGLTVPEILQRAVVETLAEVKADPSTVDVASVGAVCNISLNDQGDVAFSATYAGRSRGVFIKSAKGIEPVALLDQRIPGGEKEEVFNHFTQPDINSRGEVVFYAQWRTPKTGVDVGVFWRDAQGNLKLLFKRGDMMPK